MNVLLRRLKIHFLLPLALLASGMLYGQDPTLEVYELTMLKNTTLEFPFVHYHYFSSQKLYPAKPSPNDPNDHYHFSRFSNGNKRFGLTGSPVNDTIFYTPPQGFIGRDTIEIRRYIEFPGGLSEQAYLILHILVRPSEITAVTDYAATYVDSLIEIDVLANDFGSGTNQKIAEVTNKNRGMAVLNADSTKVLFTPSSGFVGLSHFNYSICDAQGACDMTTVSICVMDPNPPAYDSIFVQTKEDEAQVILMALDSNYSVIQAPQNGQLDTLETLVYVPNVNYSGDDKVIFEDAANNRIRVFQIDVIGPAPYESIYLKDDIVYTAIDEDVAEIHLLANDVGGSYMASVSAIGSPNTAEGGTITYKPQIGKGVYHYSPPTGFTGVDHFRYRARVPGGGLTDTATCYIIVDDLKPELPVYELIVPEETPLVMGDHLPFMDYDYQIVSNPDPNKATLTFYPGYDIYTSPYGQVVSGNNMLIYEPISGASGTDEFEVEYCVGAPNNCQLVKVEMEIVSISNPQSDTLCAGSNCVWPGTQIKMEKLISMMYCPLAFVWGKLDKSVRVVRTTGMPSTLPIGTAFI